MGRLRVIVVTTEPPDPFGNAVGRWYYVLAKGLSERGHRVRWLAAYTQESSAARAQARLHHPNLQLKFYPYPTRPWLIRKWETLRRPYAYFISDTLARDLEVELKRGYDVLHLEPTWAGYLGIGIPRSCVSILALARIDCSNRVPRSFRDLVSTALMKWAERYIITRFRAIRVLTLRDGRIVHTLNPGARIFTIPLAIDPILYPFETTELQQPTIGLIGSMSWHPTREAAIRLLTSIWPRVKARANDARLLIVGWTARHSLSQFLDLPDVTILEDVPEAEPYFRQLSVLAYPVVNGSGMKVKVLEAMAYGVPVVTTTEGIEGIAAADGVHAFLSDDDHVFADKVLELLREKEARQEIQLAARRLVEELYSPGPTLSQVERMYQEISHS